MNVRVSAIVVSLFIVTSATGSVRGDTLAVAGVALNADGTPADQARITLGFESTGEGPVSDDGAPAGTFTLVLGNVSNVTSVFVVVLADANHVDTATEVRLRPLADAILLGKAGRIQRLSRTPRTSSLAYLSPDAAKQRLKNLEEAQTALVMGGHRKADEAEKVFAEEAARILANVRGDAINPETLLMEAKGMVNKEIGAKSVVKDRIRVEIPNSKSFRQLRANRLDPAALLKEPDARIPDDVVNVLRDLPGQEIPVEWLSASLTKRAIERRTTGIAGSPLIGAFSRRGSTRSEKGPMVLLDAAKIMNSERAIDSWLTNSVEARRAVLIDLLREHQGVSDEGRAFLEKSADLPQLRVFNVSP